MLGISGFEEFLVELVDWVGLPGGDVDRFLGSKRGNQKEVHQQADTNRNEEK